MQLTQQDAQVILNEAYRLKAQYEHAKSRLGQSLWWTYSSDESTLDVTLKERIKYVLHLNTAMGIDFFYEPDDNKTLDVFYKHFVENEGE
jgi:hypothetical protein